MLLNQPYILYRAPKAFSCRLQLTTIYKNIFSNTSAQIYTKIHSSIYSYSLVAVQARFITACPSCNSYMTKMGSTRAGGMTSTQQITNCIPKSIASCETRCVTLVWLTWPFFTQTRVTVSLWKHSRWDKYLSENSVSLRKPLLMAKLLQWLIKSAMVKTWLEFWPNFKVLFGFLFYKSLRLHAWAGSRGNA